MPACPPTDSDLLAALRNGGREDAFRALVERHLGLVFGLAMRRTGQRALAEDISQNVFAALTVRAAKLRAEPTIAGWLHRATMIESADALRRESAHGRKLVAFSEHAATQPPDGRAQATHQHHLTKRIPPVCVQRTGRLGRRLTGREVWPVPDRIAQLPEPFEGRVFDDGFVEAHALSPFGGSFLAARSKSDSNSRPWMMRYFSNSFSANALATSALTLPGWSSRSRSLN